ncbi:PREDICTED: uncharacterized protein LOC108969442 isoform X2 [Bactrocera latifrons]|uniref:uncharacterized protein LOC108969442 isoform X2 n=1 Tax=Bactrocera latifrons TaxID=174628 RepID=UPI0008DCE65D|nr:PREDICTED: uncharacterized protein LOC108969442 isoform X2 [Bactrocera latifrons]
MVLRSGIIIPFQFRDSKKLLMIGVPEENRNLNIWDLRNVVRAAFGIYNFEFRNKKIGFNIPDELLLHYLAQCHDLTNFVIEIGQGNLNDIPDNGIADSSSAENFISTDISLQLHENINLVEARKTKYGDPFGSKDTKCTEELPIFDGRKFFTSASESPNKETAFQGFSDQTEESKLLVITNEQKITRSDPSDYEIEKTRTLKKQLFEIDHLQNQQNQELHLFGPGHLFENRAITDTHFKKINYQQHQFASCSMNRFRRRGERMSKDQKEMYVKYFEENPCMQSQRRNDSLLESHWNKLTSILNNIPQGAVKNVDEWKQTFDAWRYRVFMYYRYNYKLSGSVTHNIKNFKPLTSTDQRAYSMWTSYKTTPPQQSD